MRIKLCGFTNKTSIEFALKYKPNFIGFIFYPPSKRNITLNQAKEFSKIDFGKSKKIAVIVNEEDDNIKKIIDNLQPELLQLHGEENIARCQDIKNKFQLPIIKSIAIANNSSPIETQIEIDNYQKIANFLLFDTKTIQKGGSGTNFNWDILKKLNLPKEYFLSGGIDINNVKEALNISNNIILDLSSGIEERKGVKSLDKIKNLMILFNKLKKT
ncbi:phosphoribosylanthranilate isomerase [Rickettsiales bacterium]|nr:phosphoribosylanthranilate isomerase [Rickettsiales bacterium]MDB2550279.1 phosphoribosylanthranilate isomerase [Rickettsiales bacterium]